MTRQTIHVIDSHTGGEPTRVVVDGGPDLGDGSLAVRRDRFGQELDRFRSAIVNEPRGSDVIVGALLVEPEDRSCAAGVIYFNNVGCIGMCGHGTIGVVAPGAAADLLVKLQGRHGPLMFHQSGGCCDGSSPMCYPDGDFIVGDRDVLLAVLDVGEAGVPIWISGPQFEAWKHTQLVIDVVPGRGGGFSVEAPEGMRFLSRGRAFTDAENRALADHPPVTGAEYEKGARPPQAGTRESGSSSRSARRRPIAWSGSRRRTRPRGSRRSATSRTRPRSWPRRVRSRPRRRSSA